MSGVKVSKGRHSHSIRSKNTGKIQNQDGMAELEAIQSVFTQVAIWAATAMVMAIREADSGPVSEWLWKRNSLLLRTGLVEKYYRWYTLSQVLSKKHAKQWKDYFPH